MVLKWNSGELMPEGALTSSTVYDAYRYLAIIHDVTK